MNKRKENKIREKERNENQEKSKGKERKKTGNFWLIKVNLLQKKKFNRAKRQKSK